MLDEFLPCRFVPHLRPRQERRKEGRRGNADNIRVRNWAEEREDTGSRGGLSRSKGRRGGERGEPTFFSGQRNGSSPLFSVSSLLRRSAAAVLRRPSQSESSPPTLRSGLTPYDPIPLSASSSVHFRPRRRGQRKR